MTNLSGIYGLNETTGGLYLWHPKSPRRGQANLTPFVIAMIGAPLMVALLGFWALFIPVFAVMFGAPFWLLIAGPVFWHHLNTGKDRDHLLEKGFLCNLVGVPVGLAVVALLSGDLDLDAYMDAVMFFAGFGLIFAPLWTFTFYRIYKKLNAVYVKGMAQ